MRRTMLIGSLVAALLILTGGPPGQAAVVDFDSITASPYYADVTPGGARGPLLVFTDVTFNGGVVLSDSQATTAPNLYATSDYCLLADSSPLPGVITAVFNTPVSSVSLDVINGLFFDSTFTMNAYDALFHFLGSASVALGPYQSSSAVGHLSLSVGAIKGIELLSAQGAGHIDFGIDTVNYTTVPLPGAVWLLGSGLLGLGGWRRFKKI